MSWCPLSSMPGVGGANLLPGIVLQSAIKLCRHWILLSGCVSNMSAPPSAAKR